MIKVYNPIQNSKFSLKIWNLKKTIKKLIPEKKNHINLEEIPEFILKNSPKIASSKKANL